MERNGAANAAAARGPEQEREEAAPHYWASAFPDRDVEELSSALFQWRTSKSKRRNSDDGIAIEADLLDDEDFVGAAAAHLHNVEDSPLAQRNGHGSSSRRHHRRLREKKERTLRKLARTVKQVERRNSKEIEREWVEELGEMFSPSSSEQLSDGHSDRLSVGMPGHESRRGSLFNSGDDSDEQRRGYEDGPEALPHGSISKFKDEALDHTALAHELERISLTAPVEVDVVAVGGSGGGGGAEASGELRAGMCCCGGGGRASRRLQPLLTVAVLIGIAIAVAVPVSVFSGAAPNWRVVWRGSGGGGGGDDGDSEEVSGGVDDATATAVAGSAGSLDLDPTPRPIAPPPTASPAAAVVLEAAPSGRGCPLSKLLADDESAVDEFGWSLSISADALVVGAVYGRNGGGKKSGAAYVFARTPDGAPPKQVAKLLPDDSAVGDDFGWSASVSSGFLVVGARRRDDNGTNGGAAFVFARSDRGWEPVAKLLPDDGKAYDEFGWSVAISGDTLVVGSIYGRNGSGSKSGAAYVFARTDGSWKQAAKLLADDGAARHEFGRSVAISGDTLVVGAVYGRDDNGRKSGAAYVFARTNGVWGQVAKLLANDSAPGDWFGYSVSISGDTVVVGAYGDDNVNGEDSGAAYVFARSGRGWEQVAKLLADDGSPDDWFGYSVSNSGDTVIVGATGNTIKNAKVRGAAYVFARTDGSWKQAKKLIPSNWVAGDQFGTSVALFGDDFAVGAPGDSDTGNGSHSGSIYVKHNSCALWDLRARQ